VGGGSRSGTPWHKLNDGHSAFLSAPFFLVVLLRRRKCSPRPDFSNERIHERAKTMIGDDHTMSTAYLREAFSERPEASVADYRKQAGMKLEGLVRQGARH
jgi:hypothetical protein